MSNAFLTISRGAAICFKANRLIALRPTGVKQGGRLRRPAPRPEKKEERMLLKVKSTIEKYGMLAKEEKVAVGLSGGADSVALTIALKKLGYKVMAVHVNHHLRGEESDRDMHFCEEFCKKNDLPLEVFHVDVVENAKNKGLSVEMSARELRYETFSKLGNVKIATAHNLNDCVETTLFNLTRGTGLKGLTGVPAVRDNFIRPLVDITREEIENFLKDQNQPFVTDSTNNSDDYTRNKIRHNLLPEFLKINENFFENYKKFRDNASEDFQYLDSVASDALSDVRNSQKNAYDAVKVNNLPPAVKHRVLGQILKENDVEVSRERVLKLEFICRDEGKINLKENTYFVCKNNTLRCVFEDNNCDFLKSVTFDEKIREYEIFDRKIKLEIVKVDKVNKKFTNNQLDYDKIIGMIVLRGREQGDKIQLVNRDFTSTVKKLFSSLYDEETRKNRVVLSDDEGVVMVEGAGCAERCKIDSNTKRVLLLNDE